MNDTLPGRTPWEARQYQKDRGQRVGMALGLRLAADFICDDENGPLPPPFTICAPIAGRYDEAKAAVDAWAAAHAVTSGWDEVRGVYAARMPFGPLTLMVYTIPSEAPVQARPELAGAAA